MAKKSDVWNGEARGCSDVMFTRIRITERDRVSAEEDVASVWNSRMMGTYLGSLDIQDCVMALVYDCEINNRNLVDIFEEVLIEKRKI
jgi:hypothetical protein